MEKKYILVVGNNENEVLEIEEGLLFMVDLCLNFDNDPSMAALYWTVPDAAQEIAEGLREDGIKVGVYADRGKAQRFFWKSVGLSALGDSVGVDIMESVSL